MTSKERAAFRAMANSLEPIFQVGKYGVTDAVIAQLSDAFKTRELIKLKVLLESAAETPKEIAQKLAVATDSQVVQVIGGSMVFYKYNEQLHQENKPVKKPATKAQREKARKEKLKKQKAKKGAAAFGQRSRNTAERKATHIVKVRERNGGK